MNLQLPRKVVKKLLDVAGLEVSRAGNRPSWPGSLAALNRQGFRPNTVYDIGVAAGTPALYGAFPGAHFVLVDPTRESLPHMQAIARRLGAEFHNVALGEADGELEMEVRPDNIGASSLFNDVAPVANASRYSVPVRRFDQLAGPVPRPALCKIDVQGAELMVLRGMGERIHDFDAFIVELSAIATAQGAPEFFEVLAFFKQRGFVLYDVVDTTRRPLDHALAQVDVLLVPERSPLRADRRWQA